jgi:hypothetical protein
MILNGHLYSLVMLHSLFAATGDAEVKKLFDEGLQSAVALIPRYDIGYWTEYQVRPRIVDIPLAISPSSNDTVITDVNVLSDIGRRSSITFAPEVSSTFPGSMAWGPKWGQATKAGRSLDGLAFASILPGPPGLDTDPINAGSYTVSIHYTAKGCSPPLVGTVDWRMDMKDYVAIPRLYFGTSENGCEASYLLTGTNNQWSQVDEFYHDWHTRLVEELGRITGDVKLRETTTRWRGYLDNYRSDLVHRNEVTLRELQSR